ncbi:unnamed protein product [Meganyctiphanes norvegica]|uniref:Carbohydrate sulfotransferase n=1 Tax=Meganyctiphanes norvegica TaxID=48144 RepID=A0AAV2PPT1_MEGNR
MFPRSCTRLLQRFVFAVAYMYCLLLIHHYNDAQNKNQSFLSSNIVKFELESRNETLRKQCGLHPGPPTTHQKNQLKNQQNTKLSDFYHKLHLKEASKSLLYIKDHNLVWCIVPKVASTSWSLALLEQNGFTKEQLRLTEKPLQVILRGVYRLLSPDKLNATMASAVSFFFVRHPFERLVSAYRNKLEDSSQEHDGDYFYKNYGRRIVKKFRKNKKVNSKREPTFDEFVDYLIGTDINSYDEHWKPIWLYCNVCEFSYDYIIKYENFKDENSYFIDKLKATKHLPQTFELSWENRGNMKSKSSIDVSKEYFKDLKSEQIWKLYEKYEQDFYYFSYNLEGFV